MVQARLLRENETIYNGKNEKRQEVVVELPNFQKICFIFDISDIDSAFWGDLDYSNDDFIFFVENNIEKILEPAKKRNLTLLTYITYLSSSSLEETLQKLNTLNIEDIVYAMLKDDVMYKINSLYEEKLKKDEPI